MLLRAVRRTVVFILVGCGAAQSAETCPAVFADGRAPVLTNPKLAARTLALCFDAYAVLHSGVARAPLYAAERLTRASVAAARQVERVDAFHDEDRVPSDDRARLEDYAHSGYDRGHLAPAGDMPSGEAQAQSFSLANIVPQNRALNRSLWAAIEESTRRLATRRGLLFVVTGPVFSGDALASINGRVLVPTQIFKAIYDPAAGRGGCLPRAQRRGRNVAGDLPRSAPRHRRDRCVSLPAAEPEGDGDDAAGAEGLFPRRYRRLSPPRAGAELAGLVLGARRGVRCTGPSASCSGRSSKDRDDEKVRRARTRLHALRRRGGGADHRRALVRERSPIRSPSTVPSTSRGTRQASHRRAPSKPPSTPSWRRSKRPTCRPPSPNRRRRRRA